MSPDDCPPVRRRAGRDLIGARLGGIAIGFAGGLGLLSVMAHATAISKNVGLISDPVMTRDQAIIAFMRCSSSRAGQHRHRRGSGLPVRLVHPLAG